MSDRELIEAVYADLDRLAEARQAIERTIGALDRGELRVAEKTDGEWIVHEWVKEAILFFVATTGTSAQAVMSTVDYLIGWFEENPEDRQRIEDMEFVSNALQETLRLRAPFVPYLTRLAVDDVDVDEVEIKAGDEIHAYIARAGRDSDVFGGDSNQFNPDRTIPEGINRYGLAFATGPHQCLGLRTVLGNDGKSGSHLRMVQGLFRAGIRRDPDRQVQTLPLKHSDDPRDQIPTFVSFPVILDNWSKVA